MPVSITLPETIDEKRHLPFDGASIRLKKGRNMNAGKKEERVVYSRDGDNLVLVLRRKRKVESRVF